MAKRKRRKRRTVTGPVPDAVPDPIPDPVPDVVQSETVFAEGLGTMPVEEALAFVDATIEENGRLFEETEMSAQSAVDRALTPFLAESAQLGMTAREALSEELMGPMEIGSELVNTAQTKAMQLTQELEGTISPLVAPEPTVAFVEPPTPVMTTEGGALGQMLGCVPEIGDPRNPNDLNQLDSSVSQFATQAWADFGHLSQRERLDAAFGNQACQISAWHQRGGLNDAWLAVVAPDNTPTVAEVLESAVRFPGLWCEPCDVPVSTGVGEEGETCPDPICDFSGIIEAIEGLGQTNGDDCKLELWRNCKTNDLKIVVEGSGPEGDDWVLITSLADGVQIAEAMMQEACKKEDGDEDEEDKIGSLEVEGLAVDGAVNCKTPNTIFFAKGLYEKIKDGLSSLIEVSGALTIKKAIFGLIAGGAPNSVPVLMASLIVYGGVWLTENAAGRLCKGAGDALIAKIGTRALYGFFNNIIPGAFDEAITALDQQIKIECAKRLPSATEAVQAFMADEIDRVTLKCWVMANGFSWEEYERVVLASRTRLGVAELITALNRKLIDRARYESEIRELGYIQPGDSGLLHKLNEFVPGPGDIVRFMQRDVDDAGVVNSFGLDSEFGAKFSGLTKQLAADQQIPDDTMRRYWRAHWDIPSPSTLIEMFFRTKHLPSGHADKVEWNDVETALKQQDILPFWIDKYRIISQRLLTRVDTRRSFEVGVMTENEAITNYERSGYERADAVKLMEFFTRRKIDLLTRHPTSKQFVKGGVSADDLRHDLARFKLPPDDMDTLIEELRNQARLNSVSVCVKALHRRFMQGDLNSAEADRELFVFQTDNQIRGDLIRQWECEKAARGKQASVALLCKWFESGRITVGEWYNRLINLGWGDEDAIRLIADCNLKITERQETERQRRLKELQAEEKKRQAALEKEARNAKKIVEANRKKAEAMRKVREAIQRRNTTSAKDLANKLQIDIEDAVQAVSQAWRTLRTEVPMSEDQASRILPAVVKLKSVVDLESFQSDALAYAMDPAPIVEGELVV